MAITPLYNDKDALLSRLRMQDSSDTETLAVIDQVISDVRLNFFRRLTAARALEIAGFAAEENPTTTDGVLQSTAAVTEVYWVLYKLLGILPTMFIETEWAIQNSFDDVPLTRDSRSLSLFMATLKKSIEIGMGQLIEPVQESQGSFASFSSGAKTPVLINDNFIGVPFPRS
jgi:hypothetical protein